MSGSEQAASHSTSLPSAKYFTSLHISTTHQTTFNLFFSTSPLPPSISFLSRSPAKRYRSLLPPTASALKKCECAFRGATSKRSCDDEIYLNSSAATQPDQPFYREQTFKVDTTTFVTISQASGVHDTARSYSPSTIASSSIHLSSSHLNTLQLPRSILPPPTAAAQSGFVHHLRLHPRASRRCSPTEHGSLSMIDAPSSSHAV